MFPGAYAPDTEGTLPQLRSCSRPPELEDTEDTAANKMLFPTSSPSAHGLPSASDLCLGLQALSFRGWEQPWSTQDSDSSASSSSHPGEYWGRQKGVLATVLCSHPYGAFAALERLRVPQMLRCGSAGYIGPALPVPAPSEPKQGVGVAPLPRDDEAKILSGGGGDPAESMEDTSCIPGLQR